MRQIPIKLTPTPIVSAVIEIKFTPLVPSEAVFGIIYPQLAREYTQLNKLPILQVPNDIRERDPNLIYAPHYEFFDKNEKLKILVGSRVIAIVFNKMENNEYPGWTEYIEGKVLGIYEKIFASKIISKIDRFAIRYTDFFQSNIFEHTKYQVSSDNKNNLGIDEKIQISRNFKEEDFTHNIIISNNSEFITNNNREFGSIIDIDTYVENLNINFESDYSNLLKKCHILNKNQFFDILKKDYVDTEFNAKYNKEN